MGNCQTSKRKDSTAKTTLPRTQSNYVIFTNLNQLITYFDNFNLESHSYPDLSHFLGKHIKRARIVDEGKSWVAINKIQNILESKITFIIRNLNFETDAALQLIYSFKKIISQAHKMIELQTNFDEKEIELFQYIQGQLVQLSLEVLIAVNTLIAGELIWWEDKYFEWRTNYIISQFGIQIPDGPHQGSTAPFIVFMLVIQTCFSKLTNAQFKDSEDIESKAQQSYLTKFYSQMKSELMAESLIQEINIDSTQIQTRVVSHTLQPHSKLNYQLQ
ncbi:hypothetical protein pb186bvf_013717 [Paramecium bursaria]